MDADAIRHATAQLEELVAIRTAELETANKELEAFCYAVSHDLRAPLRSIDGFAYALIQDFGEGLNEEALDYIGRIRNSAKRMDELISALLSLSRLTRAEVDRQEVDLSEIAAKVVTELKRTHPDRQVEVHIQPGIMVTGDMRMLHAVLENLLSNAFKFSSRADLACIEFGMESDPNAIFVRDNGVGFDMAESSKLFLPFERLHSPREFAGSGIGLATVHRIIRKHGGSIWAEAEVGKGATFYFKV